VSWSSEVLADSPLVWWRLDDNNAPGVGPMADSSGNARHGAYASSNDPTYLQPSLVPSDANYSSYFTGLDWGQIVDAAWMDVATYTLEAWYKPANAPGAEEILVNRYSATTSQRTWLLRRSAAGKLALYHYDTGGTQRVTTGATTLLQNVAYHLAATVDGSGNVVLYVNGAVDGTGTYGVAARSAVAASIRVGDYNGGVSQPAVGYLDEVGFYGTALSGARILAHYTAGTAVPPNVPTSVAVTLEDTTAVELTWSAPSGGGPVTSYDVRLDGGSPSTATSPHTFTGLTPDTAYTLEVRAVGPGGTSSWVSVGATTLPAGPDVAYAALIRIGTHYWDIEYGDPADPDGPEVLAGATFTWSAPDTVGWPPPMWTVDRDVCQLRVRVPTAADVADVARGDVVRFKFTPLGYDYAAPLVDFAGIITGDPQLTDDPSVGGGVILSVTASDYRVLLANFTVVGETTIATDGDTIAEALTFLSYAIDVIADGQFPGGFGDVTTGAVDPRGFLAGTIGHDIIVPAVGQATALSLFAALGMVPVPVYDDNGDLDPTQPFRIVEPDPYGTGPDTPAPVSSCLVPNSSVQWRRDFTPTAVELAGSVGGYIWQGGIPQDLAHATLLRLATLDGFNHFGFSNESPESDPWTLFAFTVLGSQDPESVRDWFTYPDRVRQYVTVDELNLVKSPSGTDTLSGMLRGATLTVGSLGRWSVDAGLRAHHFGVL
jgi:hypothetical protein